MPSDYERVAADIVDRIESGEYPPGSRLPSIAELAAEYGVSATTIKTAQALLRHTGVIYGRPGRGVYVAER